MITKIDYIKAVFQWLTLGALSFVGIIVGLLFVYPLAITWLKFKYQVLKKPVPTSPFGESIVKHRDKYINTGSSGEWQFWSVGGLFWLWGNDEDGFLGEPSGKHSAREGGAERSWWGMYRWCLRNPFNNAKRYWWPMSCRVDRCIIYWVGNGELKDPEGRVIVDDNAPVVAGWYFTKSYDRTNGKNYYGFRWVHRRKNKKVGVVLVGFKVKPTHDGAEFDADDKYKGFTFRFTAWANQ